MSDKSKTLIGSVIWNDLTVNNAEEISKFYSEVIGWKPEPVNMGNYNDYNMLRPEDDVTGAGICHARGINTNLPAQWLIYIAVEDIKKSVERCLELGGKVITPVKYMKGYGQHCVIQDPAGAVCALFEAEK
ncbi:MAG: VOC family protein [Calditrichaceae bacterium]